MSAHQRGVREKRSKEGDLDGMIPEEIDGRLPGCDLEAHSVCEAEHGQPRVDHLGALRKESRAIFSTNFPKNIISGQ